MAGAGDEDVFESRLAEGDGLDVVGERLHQLGDPLMPLGLFEAQGAVDDLGGEAEPLANISGELIGALRFDRNGVAAEFGAEGVGGV